MLEQVSTHCEVGGREMAPWPKSCAHVPTYFLSHHLPCVAADVYTLLNLFPIGPAPEGGGADIGRPFLYYSFEALSLFDFKGRHPLHVFSHIPPFWAPSVQNHSASRCAPGATLFPCAAIQNRRPPVPPPLEFPPSVPRCPCVNSSATTRAYFRASVDFNV